ncbi:MAG: TetR/AcrR family transcriptional regulator [Nonomuraea sp.]|nr:TetR/AcrR family transcriptional regulator [Nonomuraea sp.]NUP67869.1 TetR/AcrR family transcriptional regulator [Nonomuraea sp.]
MGRPRGFDEAEVVRSAAELFSTRSFDGIGMDELVSHLGVHRNSLYKTFGSKRGLYQAALRWALEHDVAPLIERVAGTGDLGEALRLAVADPGAEVGLNLLLLAAVERAPVDQEVAEQLAGVLAAFDQAAGTASRGELGLALTATILGLRLRARSGAAPMDIDQAGAALARRLDQYA